VNPRTVYRPRHRDITVADLKAAEKLDSAIKLIAWYNEGGDGQMAAGVEPMLVSNSNQLAGVDDVSTPF
jgi:Homoserine dehydrogenase